MEWGQSYHIFVLMERSDQSLMARGRYLQLKETTPAQLKKEALALVFGVKRFHQYLYGREFALLTDHNPLTTILGQKQKICHQ